jgi:antitoxin ParD1/3/4/toxin ParE1/3/4
MKLFVLTLPAERDLDQIKSYLVEKAGPTIARRVMKEIRSALYFLGSQPEAGHVRDDLTSRPVKFWPIHVHWPLERTADQPYRTRIACPE